MVGDLYKGAFFSSPYMTNIKISNKNIMQTMCYLYVYIYIIFKMNEQEKVLNLLSDRQINLNGSTFRKLICNGYRYVNDLSNYSEISDHIDYDCPDHISCLRKLCNSAIIPPPDILQNRPDIYCKYLISIESCQDLFT